MDLNLQHISIGELESLANQFSQDSELVPITKARAISQSNNPHAKKKDTGLILATVEDRHVGYHGQLPGFLDVDGVQHPIYWGSTFFVSPEFRGKGIGAALLEAVKNLDKDFVATRITQMASAVLLRSGIRPLGELTYYQLRLDRLMPLGSVGFQPKSLNCKEEHQFHRLGQGIISVFSNFIYELRKKVIFDRMNRWMDRCYKPVRQKLVKQIPHAAAKNLAKRGKNSFFRDLATINWMLEYPWVTGSDGSRIKLKNYHFSQQIELFQYLPILLYGETKDTPEGFVIISATRHRGKTRLKILDLSFKHPDLIRVVPLIAIKLAKKFMADRIEFSGYLKHCFEQFPIFLPFLKRQKRSYLYFTGEPNSLLAKCENDIEFDFTDGDTAFT
jgi:GNAT superfamily N-acetyltransferase